MNKTGLQESLMQFAVLSTVAEVIAALWIHTEGNGILEFEKAWPATETESFRKLGNCMKTAANATVHATGIENR